MPTVLLCSLVFVIQVVRFKILDDEKLKELLQLFGTIDEEQIKNYLIHYQEVKANVPMMSRKDLNLVASRKVVFMNKKTIQPFMRYVGLFLGLFMWEMVCSVETHNYIPRAITELTQMNNIMDSENYLIENMIFVN